MRRHLRGDPRALRRRPDPVERALPGQPPAALVEQQRRSRSGSPRRECGTATDEPGLDGGPRVRAERDQPLLVALADEPQAQRRVAQRAFEVVDVERHDLADAPAGPVQQLGERHVAQLRRRRLRRLAIGPGGRDEALHLLDGQRLRQPPRRLRRCDVAAQVVSGHVLDRPEPVQPPHGGKHAGDARGRECGLAGGWCPQRGRVQLQRLAGDGARVVDPPRPEPRRVPVEVPPVRRERVDAEPAFDTQVVDVRGHLTPQRVARHARHCAIGGGHVQRGRRGGPRAVEAPTT